MNPIGVWISFVLFIPLAFSRTLSGGGMDMAPPVTHHNPMQKNSVDSRIIGGRPAMLGALPYQLQLRQKGFGHICGGVLVISPTSGNQIALTAAHCVRAKYFDTTFPPESFELRGGIIEVDDPGQSVPIKKIVPHSGYTPVSSAKGSANDIAVLFLDGQFKLDDYVKPINLPEEDQPLVGKIKITVSGWGAMNSSQLDTAAKVLQFVDLPLVNSTVCNTWYTEREGKGNTMIYDFNFCAGFEKGGVSACTGDSGGPAALFPREGEPCLVGVSSWGNEVCDAPQSPDVYARVSSYIGWLKEVTAQYEN